MVCLREEGLKRVALKDERDARLDPLRGGDLVDVVVTALCVTSTSSSTISFAGAVCGFLGDKLFFWVFL